MQIELPQDVQQFIEQSVADGRFATPEEAVASMVSFYRANESDLSWLRADLQVGLDQEALGQEGPMDFDELIRAGRARSSATKSN